MFLRVSILLFGFVSALLGKPLKVEVSAPSALVMNAETGAILYAKNIHDRQYPASITKIGTALYVLEKKGQELDRIVEASEEALKMVPAHVRQAPNSSHPSYRLEHDGTKMGIHSGEKIFLTDLFHGLMLSSGNDAANVLAEYVSGSIDQFILELNQYLKSQGIQETHFSNPHGLHRHDHWTTAYDMALMTRLALKHAAFREVVKTTKHQCSPTNRQPARTLIQNNRLVKPGSSHYYKKAIGVKTGYVEKAGYTFVGAATHEGRTLITVLLNCPENVHRFRDAIKLFEVAFREKPLSRTLFAKESDRFTRQVSGAKVPLDGILKDDLILNYYPAEEPAFRAEIAWNSCKFPKEGQNVGSLRLVAEDGKILKEMSVFAAHNVDQKWWSVVASFCQDHKILLLALFLSSQVTLLLFYFLKKNQKVS
jgi:D-alanyl-D-alanine carboxypeptidase (penicillin-binding protein 5/6)